MNNERSHLHNLASVFSGRLDTPQALLLAGASYRAVYEVLAREAPSASGASWTTASASRAIPGRTRRYSGREG